MNRYLACVIACGIAAVGLIAQGLPAKNWNHAEDHQNMLDQLGIRVLRPSPSGNDNAPNPANYDEAKANPYPNLPDAPTLKNGKKVTTKRHVVEAAAA
jgi:hypothetical protein